jgi:tetratricopeptide (TPR) repeat protein
VALFCSTRDRQHLDEAIQAYRNSIQLYPNGSLGHAQLAWAYHWAGDDQEAAREAENALRLDALNPHTERKLARQYLFNPTEDARTRQNAELVMRRLRR